MILYRAVSAEFTRIRILLAGFSRTSLIKKDLSPSFFIRFFAIIHISPVWDMWE